MSVAATTRVEKLQYKEILTPRSVPSFGSGLCSGGCSCWGGMGLWEPPSPHAEADFGSEMALMAPWGGWGTDVAVWLNAQPACVACCDFLQRWGCAVTACTLMLCLQLA